jgi:ATP-dependent Clp protease protease subunit
MPVGVPKVLYYWDDELPLQWIDLYNFIFRRRLVFVMSELDQDLCNQIAGMMVYIHFEDKRKELEKKGVQVVDLFEQTTNLTNETGNLDQKNKTHLSKQDLSSNKITYQDLMDYDTIWDFEAGLQKDYFMDIYQTTHNQDSVWSKDYLENPYASTLSDFQKSLPTSSSSELLTFQNWTNFNAFQTALKTTDQHMGQYGSLKHYSNLFNIWFPILPVLSRYADGCYLKENSFFKQLMQKTLFSQKDNDDNKLEMHNGHPLFLKSTISSHFMFQIQKDLTQIFSGQPSQSTNSEKNQMYTLLKNYLDWFQRENNETNNMDLLNKNSLKDKIKKSYSQDFKDQKIRDLSSYVKTIEEVELLRTLQHKKSESDDLLFTESQERMQEQRRVFVFINSTGGSVTSGITIYDALQFVQAGAVTVCLGMAFSASSMVLAGGNIGHRYVSEGAHVMIHQPEGGITGQASDVLLDAHEIMRVRRQAATIYTLSSKRSFHEVLKDLDRDYFMTPQEAIDYGLADEIVTRYNTESILDEFEKDWLADDAKQIEGIAKKIQQYQDENAATTTESQSGR